MKGVGYISVLVLPILLLCACGGQGTMPSIVPTPVPTYTPYRPTNVTLPVAAIGLKRGPRPSSASAAGESDSRDLEALDKGTYAVDLIGAWVEAGAPKNDPFDYTGVDGKTYQALFAADVLPLFTQVSIWFRDAPSCTSCHHADLANSFQELDLTSYEGILAGAERLTVPMGTPLLGESEIGATDYDWSRAILRDRLRNNRMPPWVPFDITGANRDGPTVQVGEMEFTAVDLIGAWAKEETFVDSQATFEEHVLPLFTEAGVWYEDAPSCTSCHHAELATSYHEMDLSSYEGVMAGGRRLSEPPGVPLLGQSENGASDYDWSRAILRERLRNSRMPPNMPFDITGVNRDGPLLWMDD